MDMPARRRAAAERALAGQAKCHKILCVVTSVIGIWYIWMYSNASSSSNWNKNMANGTDFKNECQKLAEEVERVCPSLLLETTFYYSSILVVFLSSVYAVSHFIRPDGNLTHRMTGYFVVAALIVTIGGILVITSACLVSSLMLASRTQKITVDDTKYDQFTDRKIIAGVGSLINAFLYIILGFSGHRTGFVIIYSSDI